MHNGPAAERVTDIPFVDLGLVHGPLRDELLEEIAALIDDGRFVNGPQVEEFEGAFAAWTGSPHCVGLASGLDALRLALLAGGIEPGDEVLVPANTFVATIESITQAGGRPVLVDASPADWNIDVDAVAAGVTPRTRFVMPVHLYGQLADMRRLVDVAVRANVEVVEDAAQAHGAERDGLRAGAVGRAGAFSFYPGKNLGAMGDAGALVTPDARLAETARALREHGQRAKYVHDLEGYTARLDTLQAVVLLRKLPQLAGWNQQRRAAARRYLDALEGVGDLVLPPVPAGSDPVWHLFVVRTERPESLAAALAERGIATGRHYPSPVHLSPAYRRLGYAEGAFPVAEAIARECLSLPIFPGISEAQVEAVVEAVKAAFAQPRA
jgi:dTDP-4-amino-4,6-dideoxygalactose transaminase